MQAVHLRLYLLLQKEVGHPG
ncbi:predicted protein [Aspergillus nidulans FGSC A4]|nr:predicted protein [Aspergillus nidulans FGSC A4]|eukprot:XP_868810.1 predicted protein [Aspergillus nidulans FGSC A4]